jgi:apolipoprotein N-acyltransferase
MKKYRLLLYALASGLLLTPGWFVWGTGLSMLFALVPLLFVEDYLYQNRITERPHKALLYSAITFFTWNILTTWWIVNASLVGMLLAVTINTVLMSTVFWAFHITRRNAGPGPGYFGLIVFWLVYEHFYLNGEISWPWLNLGNGFMNDIHIIQWYEFTGTFGGTLWVLLSNILLFLIIKGYVGHKPLRSNIALLITWFLLISVPITYSLIRFYTYAEKLNPREVVIVQPNIDPYNEKFGGMDASRQIEKMLGLVSAAATAETDYFVAPETFINDNVWEDEMKDNPSIKAIYRFLEKYPGAKFIVGLTYYKAYPDTSVTSPTARPIPGTDLYYDSFNAGAQLDSTDNIQIYIKSKLVVGVEKMPYTQYLGFLEKLTLRLGGTFRSHGTQEFRESLFAPDDSLGVATVICYESVYGEFVTEYIKAGANYIFVITNDGWWGDTPGHRQHLAFSRLRAIETRRSIARSANTGISAFINQKGEILLRTNYWTADTLRTNINANDTYTFYVQHGDFIAEAAYYFALILVLYLIVNIVIKRKREGEKEGQRE